MVDDGPGEHGDDTSGFWKRRWNWPAGTGLGIGVGMAFGMAFVTHLGVFGLAIGLAVGAALVPTFAMTMARPPDRDQNPPEPD